MTGSKGMAKFEGAAKGLPLCLHMNSDGTGYVNWGAQECLGGSVNVMDSCVIIPSWADDALLSTEHSISPPLELSEHIIG